ncbi:unnamed protein product [Vitrella brassicaformis CCMP3155]|uniref:Protein kinase domain-containing protein n=2 Tax=Vitrella brassicaformis TaxID=1169539 RepID=A0A0G4H285_VITBC|nr:unnamed protein product [Vitrella brassicaformis CCMP3155]|eukprot:CEM37773.1 unnamed protein product [Vitrella brassicaformis CCMP3155]
MAAPAAEKESEWPVKPEGYQLTAPVGYGTFATVFKALVLEGPHKGENVGIKVTELEQFPPDSNMGEIKTEMYTMQSVPDHPNIIKYNVVFATKTQLWLVMPYMAGGSCENVMQYGAPGGFKNVSLLAYVLRETATALKCLHDNDIMHRDLKAGNILLDTNGDVRLADFGVSASLKEVKTRHTFAGTPCWMAPEVLAPSQGGEEQGYDMRADVWSFGIVALELAKGEAPFQRLPPLKAMMMIIHNDPQHLSAAQGGVDQDFADTVNACLQKDPAKRPSMDTLLTTNPYKRFFAKAAGGREALVQLLGGLPSLDGRTSAPPVSAQAQGGGGPGGPSWDFAVLQEGESNNSKRAGGGGGGSRGGGPSSSGGAQKQPSADPLEGLAETET